MSKFRHVRHVTTQPGFNLVIDWDDGSQSIKRMADMIRHRVAFKALSDPRVFARARVADHGRAVRWTSRIDYCADALWAETKA
jgi:hypothetical protein